jgi:deoxyribose-phosphate aldolase
VGLGEVAARLEHRLYLAESTPQALRDGCSFALRKGLSSVITLPQDVSTVGLHLAGTSVGVVTMPGWRDGSVERLTAKAQMAEARRLAAEGASDVGVVACVDQVTGDDRGRFAEDVTSLVEAMAVCGARVRVILDIEGLTPDATAAACELLGSTGAWLVQGGWWAGVRTGLSRVQVMRAALPEQVALKWTFPVRSLDTMMICLAEGVDRFNGDPESLLKDAARRIEAGRLLVPIRGTDY